MKKDFNYKDVPFGYVHCLNNSCSEANSCLRFKIGSIVDKETSHFNIVNPALTAQDGCTKFQPDEPILFAEGVTHLYDNLPIQKYRKIRKLIHNHFEHTLYYRIYRKERLISPEDQAFIRQLFINEEIGFEPVFDNYIEQYEFFPSKK